MILTVLVLSLRCRGQTALHKAALYERRTICSLLVQAGASLTRTDYDVS